MGKNIIICSDGTGNTANKDRGTNVFKLLEAVDLNGHLVDPTLTVQVALYDDGVGTESLSSVEIDRRRLWLGIEAERPESI